MERLLYMLYTYILFAQRFLLKIFFFIFIFFLFAFAYAPVVAFSSCSLQLPSPCIPHSVLFCARGATRKAPTIKAASGLRPGRAARPSPWLQLALTTLPEHFDVSTAECPPDFSTLTSCPAPPTPSPATCPLAAPPSQLPVPSRSPLRPPPDRPRPVPPPRLSRRAVRRRACSTRLAPPPAPRSAASRRGSAPPGCRPRCPPRFCPSSWTEHS
eukprot:scaffold4406_cov112-Isochrysis_galbana.AAC.16